MTTEGREGGSLLTPAAATGAGCRGRGGGVPLPSPVFGRGEGKGEGRGPPRSGTTPTTYRYTGQRWEAGLGLYFYRARWYDPALGRFIQPDTVLPEPGDPQQLNRFSYTRNNPVLYRDPGGHRLIAGYTEEGPGWGPRVNIVRGGDNAMDDFSAQMQGVVTRVGAYADVAALTIRWLGETGPEHVVSIDNSPFVQLLQHEEGVNAARENSGHKGVQLASSLSRSTTMPNSGKRLAAKCGKQQRAIQWGRSWAHMMLRYGIPQTRMAEGVWILK